MQKTFFIALTVLTPFSGFAAGQVAKGLQKLPLAQVVWCSGFEMIARQAWHSDEEGDVFVWLADRGVGGIGTLPQDFAQNVLDGFLSKNALSRDLLKRVPRITCRDSKKRVDDTFKRLLHEMYGLHAPISWLREDKGSADIALLLVIAKAAGRRSSCHLFSPNAERSLSFYSPYRVESRFTEGKFNLVDPFCVWDRELGQDVSTQCERSVQILYDRGQVKEVENLVRLKLDRQNKHFAFLVHPEGVRQRVDEGDCDTKKNDHGQPSKGSGKKYQPVGSRS